MSIKYFLLCLLGLYQISSCHKNSGTIILETPISQQVSTEILQKEEAIVVKKQQKLPYSQELERRTKAAKLPNLEALSLTKSDFQIRAWSGFGIIAPNCYILKRLGNKLEGFYLPSTKSLSKSIKVRKVYPKSNWETIWNRLEQEGILLLPDSSVLSDGVITPDGITYIVEMKIGDKYRYYSYSAPELQKWEEAKHVVKIFDILREGFSPTITK
jgi:hypothetical protein